jgi:hypothetical protein
VSQPIPALDLWVDGREKGVSVTPTPAGLAANVTLTPVAAGNDPIVVAAGALRLRLRARTACTFKFRAAEIIYR